MLQPLEISGPYEPWLLSYKPWHSRPSIFAAAKAGFQVEGVEEESDSGDQTKCLEPLRKVIIGGFETVPQC
jgi:hypothetical protein